MTILLKKAGKFLEGRSYATGVGYRWHWTRDEREARRFYDGEGALVSFEQQTGASRVPVEPTRQELREGAPAHG